MMSPMLSILRENAAIAIVCLAFFCGFVYFAFVPKPGTEGSVVRLSTMPFQDYDGRTVRLSEFHPKLLIVYSWASWCPYCAQGFKDLAAVENEHRADMQIVAINRAEPKGDAKDFTDKLALSGMDYLLDPDDTFYKAEGGFAMPEILFINWHGDIVAHQRGPMTLAALQAEVATLLK